ncbi:hypothetical protein [Xylophilus sp. Leaf220]|uniref:hypothetical protein n=1 Tax=Xylophilus sp. Leaf220 TaxID=1735686 RepID=UPI0012E27627|nr:hypothetical protein [Xylophilus sp. Leaf220]
MESPFYRPDVAVRGRITTSSVRSYSTRPPCPTGQVLRLDTIESFKNERICTVNSIIYIVGLVVVVVAVLSFFGLR